jgi:hypothetical protein
MIKYIMTFLWSAIAVISGLAFVLILIYNISDLQGAGITLVIFITGVFTLIALNHPDINE